MFCDPQALEKVVHELLRAAKPPPTLPMEQIFQCAWLGQRKKLDFKAWDVNGCHLKIAVATSMIEFALLLPGFLCFCPWSIRLLLCAIQTSCHWEL